MDAMQGKGKGQTQNGRRWEKCLHQRLVLVINFVNVTVDDLESSERNCLGHILGVYLDY